MRWEEPPPPEQPPLKPRALSCCLAHHQGNAIGYGAKEVPPSVAVYCEKALLASQCEEAPFMLDIVNGPNAVLYVAFGCCRWEAQSVNYQLGEGYGVAVSELQGILPCTPRQACGFELAMCRLNYSGGAWPCKDDPNGGVPWRTPIGAQQVVFGQWWNAYCYACALHGARCAARKFRREIMKPKQWPVIFCIRQCFPCASTSWVLAEEVVYTHCPVRCIAVTAPWCTGILQVLLVVCGVEITKWLCLEAMELGKHVMLPLVVSPSLVLARLISVRAGPQVPKWVELCRHDDSTLVCDAIYLRHRRYACGSESLPQAVLIAAGYGFLVCCVVLYVSLIHGPESLRRISEQRGAGLLVEFHAEAPCVADNLVADQSCDKVPACQVACQLGPSGCPSAISTSVCGEPSACSRWVQPVGRSLAVWRQDALGTVSAVMGT